MIPAGNKIPSRNCITNVSIILEIPIFIHTNCMRKTMLVIAKANIMITRRRHQPALNGPADIWICIQIKLFIKFYFFT